MTFPLKRDFKSLKTNVSKDKICYHLGKKRDSHLVGSQGRLPRKFIALKTTLVD